MTFKTLITGVCLCLAWPLLAQTSTPSTEQMIQQLQAPRTRGLRNLAVEPVVRPSVSLLIQFDFNSARVRPESQQVLTNLSQALQSPELLSAHFAVEGHTDAKGGKDFNQKLSQQRAQAVSDFLKTQGVVEARLVVAGKGASELANSTDPFAAENRRVRIVNLD